MNTDAKKLIQKACEKGLVQFSKDWAGTCYYDCDDKDSRTLLFFLCGNEYSITIKQNKDQ